MKNTILRLFLFIILISFISQLFYSCHHKKKNNDSYSSITNRSNKIHINPDNYEKQNAKISLIVDSIDYIPLETTSDCLICAIDKLITKNNKYYIFDKITQSIFTFDFNGKFISKINSIGHGPGEYTHCWFAIASRT